MVKLKNRTTIDVYSVYSDIISHEQKKNMVGYW